MASDAYVMASDAYLPSMSRRHTAIALTCYVEPWAFYALTWQK